MFSKLINRVLLGALGCAIVGWFVAIPVTIVLMFIFGEYAVIGWVVLVAGFGVWGMIKGLLGVLEEEAGLRRQAREKEEARLREKREKQERHREEMVNLGKRSLVFFAAMPQHLVSAEKQLDNAEADFAEGAFAPFWTSVENAVTSLARFNECALQISAQSLRYAEVLSNYEDVPPPFTLTPRSVEKLGVGTATTKRMEAIVRTAQRNFQFARIYEQRKTNQILVAGFETLTGRLESMTWQITDSLDTLATSVTTSFHAVDSRLDKIVAMSKQHHCEMLEQVSEVEREVVEKLDNISKNRYLS